MTPFVKIPPDPKWPGTVRTTIGSQPDEFFRPYFAGCLPSAGEKFAFIERSVRLMTPIRTFKNNLYRVEIADPRRHIVSGFRARVFYVQPEIRKT